MNDKLQYYCEFGTGVPKSKGWSFLNLAGYPPGTPMFGGTHEGSFLALSEAVSTKWLACF